MLKIFKRYNDNIITATSQLLSLLKMRVTNTTLRQTLQERPDYPSLLCVMDSLKKWKVDSADMKTSFDNLPSLACPILVHLKADQIFPVVAVNNTSVTYLNKHNGEKKFSRESFLRQWDGVALLAGDDDESGEPEYHKNRGKEILQQIYFPVALLAALILIILTAITAFRVSGTQEIFYFLLYIVMLAGVVVSGLLL